MTFIPLPPLRLFGIDEYGNYFPPDIQWWRENEARETQLLKNLTDTQARCTELLEENRKLKAREAAIVFAPMAVRTAAAEPSYAVQGFTYAGVANLAPLPLAPMPCPGCWGTGCQFCQL